MSVRHALVKRGRLAEANDDFSVALRATPKNPHLLFSRAEVLEQLGRLEQALADCEAVVRGKPPEDERKAWSRLCNNVAWRLASAPAHSVDPGRVVKLARSAIDLDPSDAYQYNTYGVALYRAGRFDEALPALERSLAAMPAGPMPSTCISWRWSGTICATPPGPAPFTTARSAGIAAPERIAGLVR